MSSPITILNLGAGVQSTTAALMAVHGEQLPPIDHAIFADTQWEPAAVYAHLDRLTGILQGAGIRVHRVTAGNIREDMIRMGRGERWAAPPVFTRLRAAPAGSGASAPRSTRSSRSRRRSATSWSSHRDSTGQGSTGSTSGSASRWTRSSACG